MSKQTLFRFNIKNVKYALDNGDNTFGTVSDVAFARSIELQADYEEIKLFGDGRPLAILGDDKGLTGTLSVINLENDYEIAMKRAKLITGGIASIQQRSSVKHAIYFETDGLLDGEQITIKTWLFGCTTGKPSESYAQTEDSPTVNGYDYPLNVLGTHLMNAAGTDPYVDENGNEVFVTKLVAFPEDTGYETFGTTVPVPKVTA